VSFLLDPPALFVLGLLVGTLYRLTRVFGSSVLRRTPTLNVLTAFNVIVIVVFWVYSGLLYLNVIYFPWPFPKLYDGINWMLNSGLPLSLSRTHTTDLVGLVIFATYPFWLWLGTRSASTGFKLSKSRVEAERNRIIKEIVWASFPKGGAVPPSARDVHAENPVIDLFGKVPPTFRDALDTMLFVFDSRFMVLGATGKWKRFVDLDSDPSSTQEKRRYLEVWQSMPLLSISAVILKLIASYGYYTSPGVWSNIDYNGPMRPNDPPWYRKGP
jgi:hypothetical protein